MTTDRPLNPVFILGAPRSGTTWLQQLLGCHESIATAQETKLMYQYVAPLYSRWRDQPLNDLDLWRRARFTGLASVISETEFLDLLREFASKVYESTLLLKPTASLVLDKDPPNSMHVPMIMELFPEARFVHIVRDGRDVAASMLRASRSWGRTWLLPSTYSSGEVWRKHVEAARAADKGGNYFELSYERLKEHPAEVISEVLSFLGLPCTEADGKALVEAATLPESEGGRSALIAKAFVWGPEVAKRGYQVSEPEGFFGDQGGSWVKWSGLQRLDFEDSAGALLKEFGYDQSGWKTWSVLEKAFWSFIWRPVIRRVKLKFTRLVRS